MSSEAKFTAGPLRVVPQSGIHRCIPIMAEWECDGKEPYHPLIAEVRCCGAHAPMDIAIATARLFAAAPNLYAACERACDLIEELIDTGIPSPTLVQLRAALAKANPPR